MNVDEENAPNDGARRKKKERKNEIKQTDSTSDDKQMNGRKRKKNVSDHADDGAKILKLEDKNIGVADNDENNADDGIERPEKGAKKPSKRQLKKEKAEQRIMEKRKASKQDAAEKAITYVSKWKHTKNDWKFEKLRQIWLMDHLLDDELVPDEVFPVALEYFEGCKGMARQQLVKKMMDVIRKVEEQRSNEEEESERTDSTEYLRARQVLQALPTEA